MKLLNRGMRISGIAVPLLSLRSAQGPCGEFPDLGPFGRLAKSWGARLVQLLPLNETGSQTSPYSALSAFALNPIYLRLGDLPEIELPGAASIRAEADALSAMHRDSKRVDYGKILEAKLSLLSGLWGLASSKGEGETLFPALDRWIEGNPWVKPYALFMTLREANGGKPWWEWTDCRDIDAEGVSSAWKDPELLPRLRFRAWIQMRAFEQFSLASSELRGEGIDLMGDIPILMNADSADVWWDRSIFDLGKTAGAPPDMYAGLGQNWGFPLYRWDELERRGFDFWKNRLSSADHFYSAYRIDHVLGFFRIWAIGKGELDGFLGHFVPEFPATFPELAALGFDSLRIRWLSQPHVPESAVREIGENLDPAGRETIIAKLFERIGEEPLFLFTRGMRSASDIATCIGDSPGALDRLLARWRDRALLEIAPGQFVLTWEYGGTTAWKSLSEHEKASLEALFSRRRSESMALWEKAGRKILGAIVASVPMQACAEDLGAVPPCVPAVLGELGIPGLRVLRWHREWGKPGAPYIALEEYPENSMACLSVHDSTNLRQWWIEEADRPAVWAIAREFFPALPAEPPASLEPDSALALVAAFGKAKSRFVVHPLQDLLAASARYRETSPEDERINVPGTSGGTNWLYRMKPGLEELLADGDFAERLSRAMARD